MLKACRRSVPDGSRYRLGWLERGRCICWKAWPDGRGAKEMLKVAQAVKEAKLEDDLLEEKEIPVATVFGGRCPVCSRRECWC